MDLQQAVVDGYGGTAELLAAAQRALAAARSHEVPVIYVRLLFRRGHPEVSSNNEIFSRIGQGTRFTDDDPATGIAPQIAPEPGDVVVTKKRISAFAGSDLEYVLRARSIAHLVIGGIATSGVVLSTLRQASDLDFRATVLRDACADTDDEVHRVLLDKVFPRQARVITVDEWTAQLDEQHS